MCKRFLHVNMTSPRDPFGNKDRLSDEAQRVHPEPTPPVTASAPEQKALGGMAPTLHWTLPCRFQDADLLTATQTHSLMAELRKSPGSRATRRQCTSPSLDMTDEP